LDQEHGKESKALFACLLPLSVAAQFALYRLGVREQAMLSGRWAAKLRQEPCEFLEFKRPLPETRAAAGAFFTMEACPPKPSGTSQSACQTPWGEMYKSMSLFSLLSSLRFALSRAFATLALGSAMYLVPEKNRFLGVFGVGSAGDAGVTSLLGGGFGDVMTTGALHLAVLAIFLLCLARQELGWLTLVNKIMFVKRGVQLLSSDLGAKVVGNDAASRQVKCDIHRWISAAHFFALRTVSPCLQHHDAQSLASCGVLAACEVAYLQFELPFGPSPAGEEPIDEEGEEEEEEEAGADHRDQSGSARSLDRKRCDMLLSWVQLWIQLAMEVELMEQKACKPALARVRAVRDAMSDLASEADKEPIYLWSILLQVLVDTCVVLLPLSALKDVRHGGARCLFGVVAFSFVTAYLCNGVRQLVIPIWDRFRRLADAWRIDALIVSAERTSFARLCWSDSSAVPEQLRTAWEDAVKRSEKGGSKAALEDLGASPKTSEEHADLRPLGPWTCSESLCAPVVLHRDDNHHLLNRLSERYQTQPPIEY